MAVFRLHSDRRVPFVISDPQGFAEACNLFDADCFFPAASPAHDSYLASRTYRMESFTVIKQKDTPYNFSDSEVKHIHQEFKF